MKKIQVFIGSSTEGIETAIRLQSVLESTSQQTLEARVWTDGIFNLSEVTLESLLSVLPNFDYAVFLFRPDDVTVIRGKKQKTARDNVIFESGLFIGIHGKMNFIILKPKGSLLHLPSDLAGITWVDYDQSRLSTNYEAALRSPSLKIIDHIRKTNKIRLEQKRPDVEFILEIAARLVADRAGLPYSDLRAFCHLFDPTEGKLKPFAHFVGGRQHLDAWLDIPCTGHSDQRKKEDWFIISRAFRRGQYICEDINWKKVPKSAPECAKNVRSDLKAVAACPLRPFRDLNDKIGTICVDAAAAVRKVKWSDYSNLEYVLTLIADRIFHLLK